MRLEAVIPLVAAPATLAQSVLSVLQTRDELSTLSQYVQASKRLPALLESTSNFTFLAPSNDAFATYQAGSDSLRPGDEIMDVLLAYHLVKGSFPTVEFTHVQRFVSTYLEDKMVSNVTDGQSVGIASNRAGPFVISGNKTQVTLSSQDIVVPGGFIHVTNNFLTLPIGFTDSITELKLNYFIGILSTGGFLSPDPTPEAFSHEGTIFAPNSHEALQTFTSRADHLSKAELSRTLHYHIVPGFKGYSSNLADGMILTTSSGDNLYISIVDNVTYVNQYRVLNSNYLLANGVLHTIENVLDFQNISIKSAEITTATSATHAAHIASIIATCAGIMITISILIALIWYGTRRYRMQAHKPIDDNTVSEPEHHGPRLGTVLPAKASVPVFEMDASHELARPVKLELESPNIPSPRGIV